MKKILKFNQFNRRIFYKIACIISNEYIGSENHFIVNRKNGYHFIDSNLCDYAPMIKIYNDQNSIIKIEVNGDYTDGWQLIQNITMDKINNYINAL